MFRRILILLLLAGLAACHSTKPVVRTTKKVPPQNRTRTAHKPKPSGNTGDKARAGSTRYANRSAEVIESTSRTVVYGDVVEAYVQDFKDIAMGNMRTYGIPASIILAQGILESGAGRGDLALGANNHFGIKCHNDWTGETVNHDDDSDRECFRKYKDPADSYKDHALFLTGRNRYAELFSLPKGDYEAWARGLRKAGYATDPKYPEKLITYIEKYHLHQYDSEVLGTDYVPLTLNKSLPLASIDPGAYEVQKGDTLYSIARRFNISIDDLKQKNGLIDNTISVGQKLIIP